MNARRRLSGDPEDRLVARRGEPIAQGVPADGPEMAAAIASARASVGALTRRLRSLRVEGAPPCT